jgi:hypothetical protein
LPVLENLSHKIDSLAKRPPIDAIRITLSDVTIFARNLHVRRIQPPRPVLADRLDMVAVETTNAFGLPSPANFTP